MLLAAMLAMMLVASSPAWAQQTSGSATGAQAVWAPHAGNVAVQQLQNVNSGNVNQEQAAANVNEQVGFAQTATATAEATGEDAEALAIAANIAEDVDVTQTQTVDQSITQSQEGIEQTNNAFQLANQTLNR
jgi:hypothetical protein